MLNNQEIIDIGTSEFRVASRGYILRTVGIGSCIVIALYDPVKKIGALSHSMLPGESKNDPKYVGSAIELMIKDMASMGAQSERLEARIVGGADVLQEPENNSQDVGLENIKSATEKLKEKGIKIVSRETGKNFARNVTFNLTTGQLIIKAV